MVRPLKFRDWRNLDNFLIRNHGHAVADGIQAVEIMGHHHDSKPQRVAQRPYQLVKFRGCDRVEARSGFVKEQQFWIERQGPRYAYTRSEEHTSELQSLMRISYAVFCLKKKHKVT